MIAGDQARVQTFVRVPLQRCFDIFTLELDAWWRRGRAYRVGGKHEGPLHLEPRLGGRVFQEYGEGHPHVHEIGVITAWAPPAHFAFSWRGINFKDGDPSTTVEVWFEASGEGTRVTLEHRGFAALREDHPVRHGAPAVEFLGQMGRWWGSLVTALRLYAEERP
ncbi:MAG: SRPBCC domain-containing protein [Kofleriaceae bacterium]